MAEDRELKSEALEVTGKLITSIDPTQLGKGDFKLLSNMRYTDKGIKSTTGMSKINSAALTEPVIKSGTHFLKDSPSESHVIVQSFSNDGTTSSLYDSTNAVPGTGTFSSLYTETAGADTGRFVQAPDGVTAYGNGKDLLVWGGNESRCAGFVVADTDGTTVPAISYDYTNQITDNDTTTVAYIKQRYVHIGSTRALKGVKFYISTPNDAAVTLTSVKYWDGNPLTRFAAVSTGTYGAVSVDEGLSWEQEILVLTGTTAMEWNGSYYCAVGNANGTGNSRVSTDGKTWTQSTVANYQLTNIAWNGSVWCTVGVQSIYSYTSTDGLNWTPHVLPVNLQNLNFSCLDWNGTAFCLIANGSRTTGTSADGITWTATTNALPSARSWSSLDWNGSVWCAIAGGDFNFSNAESTNVAATSADGATWSAQTMPSASYWSAIKWNGTVFCAIAGSPGQATNKAATCTDGATANWNARTLSATKEWRAIDWDGYYFCAVSGGTATSNTATTSSNGTTWYSRTLPQTAAWSAIRAKTPSSGWQSVTNLVDGTASGGKTLAQTGSITFNTTVNVAAPKYFNSGFVYWYLFDFNGVNTQTSISRCTVDAPIQPITDLWDGVLRQITAAWHISDDISSLIFKKDFVSGDTTTYYNANGFTTAGVFYFGFAERMTGLKFDLGGSSSQTNASNMLIDYWNGVAWKSLTIYDGTSSSTHTLSQSGFVTWDAPNSINEFKTSIITTDKYYYYRMRVSSNLSATNIYIDDVFGISAFNTITSYKFPATFQNRLVLCNDQSNKGNSILIGASYTSSVFNGTDITTLEFGDNREITAAIPFFSRFSNAFFENLIVGKSNSLWVVDGTKIDEYKAYQISSVYGVSAPGTLTACDLGFAGGTGVTSGSVARNVIIFQSNNSIVMWEGSIVFPIDQDISDVFDPTNSNSIEPTMMNKSTAFFDSKMKEWHWLWASKSSTTLNKEYVFDVIRKKWFTIDRGTGKRIQLGISVVDTNNNKYCYGATTDGYVERLENGQTFDGNSIVSVHQTGDVPLGGWGVTTAIRKIRPILKSKNTTANKLSITYYADTETSSTKTITFNVGDSSHRIVQKQAGKPNIESLGWSDAIFHSLKCSMTTTDEDVGYEPIGLLVTYKQIRQDIK